MCFGIISLDLISLLLLFGIKYIISEESSFGPTFLINVYKFGRVEAEVSKLLEKLPLKQAEGLCWLLQCWAFSAETSININNRYLQCCWRERERERESWCVGWELWRLSSPPFINTAAGEEILLQFLSLNAIICFPETCLIKQIKSLDFRN